MRRQRNRIGNREAIAALRHAKETHGARAHDFGGTGVEAIRVKGCGH